ncbi:MAG: selenide, water dikinase SelD [Candidatus Aminicenantes bacterium]|nr:MAG: selenide, water dikinase SelD [Candidatus Aminicenantes bacterium]
MADKEKRKQIMQRSIKLGQCICNPKQPCPCDLFKQENVCLCAGERLGDMPDNIPLTQFVENAGCASKINQTDLKIVLAGLPAISNPKVLVSANTCDDAGVYKLTDDLALVQSVDVFTPNVDDPHIFGQIAAANSLSDIYAMGGEPLTALSVVGFPIETMSHLVMNQMLRGGIDKMKEAGVEVIGGHSIKDTEIKFGFAVTGVIDPKKIITNDKAEPGDVLILTKPLGTGVISFASQLGRASREDMAVIGQSMAELNKVAAEAMVEAGVTTATDVTGFGLMGHLSEMVAQSKVTAEIFTDQVPFFKHVLGYVREELISGAIERNREYATQYVEVNEGVSEDVEIALYDPQTSGGFLIAVKEDHSDEFVAKLKGKGVNSAAIIGRVVSESDGKIILTVNPKN